MYEAHYQLHEHIDAAKMMFAHPQYIPSEATTFHGVDDGSELKNCFVYANVPDT